ncbi:uncharacterized protein LOC123554058 [Mercenaria mercenaria]|uniref:uncharacterized protein LOC123554058 n=1 Tax=Mercenaria mercenaria TaxID=6596 RepID=UPI00234EE2F8|nr:uncharacterized protein LOC123554058 [Mercenaria mercenaria]
MDTRKEPDKNTETNDAKKLSEMTKDSPNRVKNMETDRNFDDISLRPNAMKGKHNFGRRNFKEELRGAQRKDGHNAAYDQRSNTTKKLQAKRTTLYVVVSEKVTQSRNLKGFLLYRMGHPKDLDFAVTSVSSKKDDRNKSVISLQFESFNKASLGKHLLHKSNRNAPNKVMCFLDAAEAEGQVVDTTKQRQEKIAKAQREIAERAEDMIRMHDAKINDVRERLSDVDKQIGNKHGVSLFEYDKLCNEKLAFEDKLEELGRQRKEFNRYMNCLKEKLEALINCDKFEKEIQEVRKAFGVECRRFSAALPMYARREDILTTIGENQVCVILGETGSGKSTQMVQYLYQAGFAGNGIIACTQPRKIAAVSLATHVSSELASSVGQVVGYKVGMQKKMTAVTKVLFLTDHILLNECLLDRLLKRYSCILIDEAHERSIHTDLLLGMLKEALDKRPDLKVIITSATIDPDIFVKYFGGRDRCPVLKVSGRAFPVDVFWEQDIYSDRAFPEYYETKALNKAIEIHRSTEIGEGDILVFLTAVAEIERCTEKLTEQIGDADVQCLQLHGRLKPEEQQLVFEKTPRGKRKIVFATNSAETSITIPGIKFVVDTGVAKEMRFDPKKNMNSLNVVSVSQSSANQRKGRAGRTASGICYRLYTEEDYMMMEKASSPEILRIQVAQALLKLMELGVDPMKFDYVQSPSLESMESAMVELKSIGAVNASGISELGRWIAKLPVEPRFGVLIKKGIDMETVTETLIVASCCNQSGIFFRVGTLEEKKAADLKKMKFCHHGGDLLTMLNVYREWDKVKEREKGSWCDNNSINGKAMKGVRDMTNEITSILKKDLGLKIKHEFKSPEEADRLVQSLIFECMASNLGYYLGHECAGYLIINRFQRVKLHPSSAILALGLQPSWVVFNKVLKTSEDFITEVTPVSSEVVNDAVEKKKVGADLETLANQRVNLALKIPVGKHVIWKFVGPMHKNRRKVEEDIGIKCDESLVVIDANKKRGEISLFCLPQYEDKASYLLRSIIEPIQEQVINESREESIGNERSGIRAVLREGGGVVEVLMPYEYRSLKIWQKKCMYGTDIAEDSIREVFRSYGPVEQIWRPTGRKQHENAFWGKVTFTHQKDAVVANQDINNDTNSQIRLEPITFEQQSSQEGFTMKVTWCRRPSKGHCFVSVERPEDLPLLLMSSPRVNGNLVTVSLCKRQSDLFIKGLPSDVTDDNVKRSLAEVLGLSFNSCRDRFRVVIPRMNVIWSADQRVRKQEELSKLVLMYAQKDSFRIHIKECKQQTVMCTAFVTFSDAQICNDTAKEFIQGQWKIDGNKIYASLECKSSVHVNKKLYQIVKEDVQRSINGYADDNSNTSLEARTLKSGHISLDIKADTPLELAKAKVRVDHIVGGATFGYESKKNIQVMFCKNGRQKAQEIETETKTLVFIDEREMTVTIQGGISNRTRAAELLDDYIANQKTIVEVETRMKGGNNPPGLMKALITKYGITFETLKKETDVTGIQLNLRLHEMTITGKEDAVKKALNAIKEMREEIIKRYKATVLGNDLPDCPICLCPVEESDMYRLEYCGHAYCKVCVTSLIQNAVFDRQLPVICAAEGCVKPLVIRDINTQIKMGTVKRKAVVDSAVACFVSKNNRNFHFCLTPDCVIIYRATSNGGMFVCPMCRMKICTSCHALYHEGLTCAMYKMAKKEGDSVLEWHKEDPLHRRMCPNCGFGIEKTGGCDHMECTLCKANICWKCMAYFPVMRECYGHMATAHHSFV